MKTCLFLSFGTDDHDCLKSSMDPFLSKIGNVTIQRLPLKQNDNGTIEKPSTESKPSLPPASLLQLPKLPPSINISIKSSNVASESCENEQTNRVVLQEPHETKDMYDSDYSDKLSITDEENSETSETETCDNLENAQEDGKLPDAVDETNLPDKVDLEGLAAVEMLQSASIIEELPNIKEELMDAEEFRRVQATGECEETSNVVTNDPSEDITCKEEKYSDDEEDPESEEDSESEEADDEHDDQQSGEKIARKKKRKPKSEEKEPKKQKTVQGKFRQYCFNGTNCVVFP